MKEDVGPTDEELEAIANEEEAAFKRGIRLQVATQLLSGLLASGKGDKVQDSEIVSEALEFADELIKQVSE